MNECPGSTSIQGNSPLDECWMSEHDLLRKRVLEINCYMCRKHVGVRHGFSSLERNLCQHSLTVHASTVYYPTHVIFLASHLKNILSLMLGDRCVS